MRTQKKRGFFIGVILFVHGMGHSEDREYWRPWASALAGALAGLGVAAGGECFGGVYYYDLVPGPAAKGQALKALKVELLESAARDLKICQKICRPPFNGARWRGLGVLGKLAAQVVDNFGDILTYLYLDRTHEAVNARLLEAVEEAAGRRGPVALVGYSLGSLVSYCALKANPARARQVAHLLMVGSPMFWFRRGVEGRVGLAARPAVGRFASVAGVLDIAWPQAVPEVVGGLDKAVEFVIDPFDPVRGHRRYFTSEVALAALAAEIVAGGVLA